MEWIFQRLETKNNNNDAQHSNLLVELRDGESILQEISERRSGCEEFVKRLGESRVDLSSYRDLMGDVSALLHGRTVSIAGNGSPMGTGKHIGRDDLQRETC